MHRAWVAAPLGNRVEMAQPHMAGVSREERTASDEEERLGQDIIQNHAGLRINI